MDGVAAKIAQEIGVLFEHDHIDAGARQQEAQHHAGRSAAGDAATRREGFRRHRHIRSAVPPRPKLPVALMHSTPKGAHGSSGGQPSTIGCTATALHLPACGERDGVRGSPKHGVETYTQGNARPGPSPGALARADLSPQAGRGERNRPPLIEPIQSGVAVNFRHRQGNAEWA